MQEFIKLKLKAGSSKKTTGMLSPSNLATLMKTLAEELEKLDTTPDIVVHDAAMQQY